MLLHQSGYSLTALLIGLLGYRTGVDDTDIGLFATAGSTKTNILEGTPNGRGLREVELATQRVVHCLFIFKLRIVYHRLQNYTFFPNYRSI
jgi:hypothetical protein